MTKLNFALWEDETMVNKRDLALAFSKAMKDARETGCDISIFVSNRLLATVKPDGEIVKPA